MRNARKLLLTVAFFTALLCAAAPRTAVGQAADLGCGLHANSLHGLYEHLEGDEHRDLKGVVVLCDGKRVSEAYFNGDTVETLHDIRSATKSITATLMGIAIQRGLVHSVNDSIEVAETTVPAVKRLAEHQVALDTKHTEKANQLAQAHGVDVKQ